MAGATRPVSFEPVAGSGNRYMTLDDVVVRTAAMLVVVMLSGSVSWALANSSVAGALILVGVLGGLGLGLYIAFTTKANAFTSLAYAAFEGLFLGAVSRAFESAYPGIVVQAITGTIMVAAGMLFVYKIGAIRVTPRLWRVVAGATIGLVGLMLVNLIASFFHSGGLGLREGGLLGIGFSLLCIVIASLNLVLDFDLIERSIRRGTDEKFAWYCAFGIMVTLIWLYLEILRLLGNLRN
nr:Bax inhibitor-1/YccA family protein [Jatrophihabitans sp. GAS493]